jgi:glycosyltransferase involved in cell wall biosynthesis
MTGVVKAERSHQSAVDSRLRLLLLTPFSPRLDASHGGARAIAQLVSRLAERHDVALLCVSGDDEPPVDDVLRSRCELVEEFLRRGVGRTWKERWSRRARLLSALARGQPMWVADSYVAEFATRVRQVAETWSPDVIQMEYHVMSQYRRALGSSTAPVVLTQYDPGSAAARETVALHRGMMRAIQWLDARTWTRFERRALGAVDAVVTFTERDRRETLRVQPDASVTCIPLATEVPSKPLSAAGEDPPSIVFIGNFAHPPNVDAATRLVVDIFPRLEHSHPQSILYIVGEGPPRELASPSRERVIMAGRVPDVTPYLDAAAVIAVPIRTGGGMRVKVLEALAAGKAVVASDRALEGLDVVDREHVLVAETDAEFADAIGRLLADRELRMALAGRARQWACTNVRWDRSIESYEALYNRLLAKNHQSPAAVG